MVQDFDRPNGIGGKFVLERSLKDFFHHEDCDFVPLSERQRLFGLVIEELWIIRGFEISRAKRFFFLQKQCSRILIVLR